MKKTYLKVAYRYCPICQNPMAETIGYFIKKKLIRVSGTNCVCGNREPAVFSREIEEPQKTLWTPR